MSATGSENGRKRVREAAEIRQDKVLELIHDFGEDQFVYHMSNDCYKSYTHKQHLERIKRQKLEYETIHQQPSSSQDELQSYSTRSKMSARDKPSQDVDAKNLKCVICGHEKHSGVYQKYRICERERAAKFLEAKQFYQDEVYIRTSDILDIVGVFAADLYCHKICLNSYILRHERLVARQLSVDKCDLEINALITAVIDTIKPKLESGIGYTLSEVTSMVNSDLPHEFVTNRDVKTCLQNIFGDSVRFSKPGEANLPIMFFHSSVTEWEQRIGLYEECMLPNHLDVAKPRHS